MRHRVGGQKFCNQTGCMFARKSVMPMPPALFVSHKWHCLWAPLHRHQWNRFFFFVHGFNHFLITALLVVCNDIQVFACVREWERRGVSISFTSVKFKVYCCRCGDGRRFAAGYSSCVCLPRHPSALENFFNISAFNFGHCHSQPIAIPFFHLELVNSIVYSTKNG